MTELLTRAKRIPKIRKILKIKLVFVSGDLLMKSTQNKLSKVLAEVDSLKAVLEMRTEEIHALRLEKAKLEDKLDDFDRMKISLNKVTAQMEDLKAQLNEKQALERKLSEENRQLYNNMEREKNAQRRLTMEKEELEWKMKSFSAADSAGPMSMSMMETGNFCQNEFLILYRGARISMMRLGCVNF